MNTCRQRVEALRFRVRAQVHALWFLESAFAKEAEHLRRRDQARCLDALRAKVARQVEYMRRMETAASSGFTKATIISGLAKFAIGSLIAATLPTEEHPLSVGAQLAASDFGPTAPFGTVVVALGPGGLPDEVDVVPLSRRARELGSSESDVAAALEAQGYHLMTPETFYEVLEEIKEHVLKGVATLPVANASFLLKPFQGDSE